LILQNQLFLVALCATSGAHKPRRSIWI